MQIKLKPATQITVDKSVFVEEQANRLLDFIMESRAVLSSEAHTTLNWMFAVIVGGTGYLYSTLNGEHPLRWWIMIPVGLTVLLGCVGAFLLFHMTLRTTAVLPKGNEPRNLLRDDLLEHDIEWIRLAEAAQLQERIDIGRQHNERVGDAINHTRLLLIAMPIVGVVAGVMTALVCRG